MKKHYRLILAKTRDKIKILLTGFLFLILPGMAFSQVYTTTGAGAANWNNVAIWLDNGLPAATFPTDLNSTSITISRTVNINLNLSIDQATIATGGSIVINATRTLTIADDGTNADDLTVNAGTISGTGFLTIAGNATFNHARNGGTIPLATWNAGSTCLVTGIVGTSPTLNATSSYENFTWNCPGQTATITLASNLRDVNAILNIEDTNNQQLRFGTATAYTLNIDGDFNVTGNSRIAFGTTAAGVVINLLGSFDFSSTAATASLLKSSGSYSFNVTGNVSVSSGLLTMSTGNNAGTITIGGDFTQLPSTITETGGGSGAFTFNGSSLQNISSTGTISNTIDFTVNNAAGIVLNSPFSFPGAVTQTLGDIDLNNQIVTFNGNFSQASGNLILSPSVELIVQGAGTLPASVSFSGTDLLRLEMNRAATTLTTSSNFTVTTLNLLNGTVTHSGILTIADGGTIERRTGSITNAPAAANVYNVLYSNTGAINTGPELPTSTTALNNLTKQGAGTATLNQALVTINGNFTTVVAGGTFAMAANSISLAGNFNSAAALTATTGSASTFTITGNCLLTSSNTPQVNNLVVNGTLTPGGTTGNYRVNGNYTVGPGATVNAGVGTVTFGGTTVVTNNGTMNLNNVTFGAAANTMTAPVTTMGIAGNFTSSGIFNNGGGTILFNGTSALSAAEVYNNITISGTVTSANVGQTVAGSMINNNSFNIGTGNLTWSGSGTLSGTGTTTVADVVVSGSSFTYTASGNLTLNDDITGAGSFDSSGSSGTVIFAGGGSSIAAGGSRTFRSISVTGTFTPATTYTLVGAGGLDVSGTLVSGGTIVFGGTTQTITGSSLNIAFNIFTTNVGSDLTITPDITINGNLAGAGSITSNGRITFVGLTMSGTGTKNFNNVTVGTGTLTPNANYTINGNLVVTGTLAAGNATTTFGGTTTISGAGTAALNIVNITGTLTGRLISEPVVTVNGNFTNGGTFNGSSGSISLGGNLVNNGNFNGNTSTFSFNTTNSATRTITGTGNITFNNLTIFDKGQATDVSNNLTPPATVDIAGALSFGEAAAVLDGDGGGTSVLRLLSTNDSPAADGRIAPITFANSNITGNFTAQRYVSSENRIYRYIASPVVGASVAQLKAAIPVTGSFTDPSDALSTPPCSGCITTNPSLFSFNETTQLYDTGFPASGLASATNFANGRGYSAFFRHTGLGAVGIVTINFVGSNPSTTGFALPVSSVSGGFSLVGNPYPSPIVWGATGWTRNNIGDVIVVRNNATGGMHESHGTADNFIIAPGQSFWVQSSGLGASLQIAETAKSTSGAYEFYKTSEPIVDQVELLLTKITTGATDNARIMLVPGSSLLYESSDGVKFDNSIDNGTTITQVQDISTFSTDATPKSLALNAIPTVTCGQVFSVKTNNLVNSGEITVNYTLTVNPSGSLKGISWVLHDNYVNLDVDVSSNATYNFSVDNAISASKATNRFTLKAVSAPAIDLAKSVTASASVCTGSEAILTVASQNGFTYGVEINNGTTTTFYPNLAQGDGGNITIFLEDAWLSVGSNNTIRIKASSGCDSQFLTASAQITKEDVYTAAGTSASSCVVGPVTLSAMGAAQPTNYHWYASETSSAMLASGNQFITPVLSDTTTYYVAAFNSLGCDGPRVPVTAYINNLADQFTVDASASIVCRNSTMTFTANSLQSGTYKWYETPSSPNSISANAEFTTPQLTKTTKYYVSFINDLGCEGDRKEITAQISNFAPVLWADNDKSGKQICPQGSYTFTANGAPANTSYAWFESMESEEPIIESTNFTTPSLDVSRNYYMAAKNELGCFTDRFVVEAVVDASKPIANFSYTSDKVCKNDVSKVKLTSTDPNNVSYRWYDSPSSELSLKEGFEYTTDVIGDDQTYYVAAVNANGCEGTLRKEVIVVVTKFPDPTIEASTGLLTSNFTTGNEWFYDEELLGNEKSQTLTVTKPGLYNLRVSYQGCSELASPVFRTDFVTGIEDEVRTIELYPNPTSDRLSIRVSSAEPVKGEFFDERGVRVLPIPLKQEAESWNADIDVRNLSKGLYFLRLSAGSKSVTHKVIIK